MATSKFAKLFEFDDIGQVLVVKDTNEEGDLVVRFSVQPEGLGVCSISPGWPDGDDGEQKWNETFDKCDSDMARTMGQRILDSVKDFQ